MIRKFALFIVFILFLSAISIPPVTGYTMQKLTTFSDATAEKTLTFPSGGGTDQSSSFQLPKKAIVTDAYFNVSTVYNQINYPNTPRIDIGADGDLEWAFSGTGYGAYGQQNVFSDNMPAKAMFFDDNTTFDNEITFIMPKNSSVSHATMNVRGSGAGNILLVTDGANSYGVNLMKTALENIGNTVTLAKENTLPVNWSQPGDYKAIFWVGGTSSNNGPSSSLLGSFVNYVKGGGNVFMCGQWIDYTGSYSGVNEIPFFTWVLHHYWGNQWSGGGGGNGGKMYTHQYNTSHPVFTTPNQLPHHWNHTVTTTVWNSPYGPINNGSVIGKIDTTWNTINPKWNGIIAWDGPEYNGVYGRTLVVRQPIARLWFNNTDGDVLSNFTQNVASWFLGVGKAANVTANIGDNGGSPEFNHSGELNESKPVSDFSSELNSLIASSPVVFTDKYGIQFVEILINITNDENGTVLISGLDIKYNLTTKAFINPHNYNLINELNELIPDTGEGNVTIPISVRTGSGGKLNLSDISIDYYVPDLTNDILVLLNGHGLQNICYADYEYYTFNVNVTNKAGANNIDNVTLILDANTEKIELCWNRGNNSFWELDDPKNLITLNTITSNSNAMLPDRWNLNFIVKFNWAYPDQTLQLCTLNTTNNSGSFDFDHFEQVYRVETDLELIGDLDVVSQDEGVLIEDGTNNWVHASETITWSNLTAVYEDTTNIYPADKNFNITIIDNDNGKWVNSSSSGNKFVITTVSDPVSDHFDTHYINITEIPGIGRDVSDWKFMVKTDNDGPLVPPNLLVRADSAGDIETNYDDDAEVYITWTPGSDAGGSGILEYAMGYENNKPTTIKESGCKGNGEEGASTFYVRARDRVGNWGTTGSASIFIDLTNLNFAESIPPSEIWHTSKTVECGITIKDLSGSGVMASSIQYRFVDKGHIGSGSWNSYQTQSNEEIIVCRQNITFKNDGVEKKVQWRAKDLAGNGYIESNIFNLKIDSTPVTFESFGFNLNVWHNTLTPEIKFYINDTNPNGDESSGVDVGNIFYSYSTVGDLNYVDWEPSYPSGSGNSVICTINPTLEEGNQNYFRFKGFDLAGNEIISEPYRVKIDISKPIFSEPVPSPTTWCNRTHLQCNITISDQYSKLDVQSVKYSISINGTDHYSNWRAINIKYLEKYYHKNITLSCNETFAEGEKDYIRWRVMDTAGNMIISDDYHILIDISRCVLQNPTPAENTWLNEVVMDCGILISDSTGTGSGIDLDSIEYALSVDGLNNIKSWKRDGIEKEELTNIEDDDEGSYPNSNCGPTLVFAYVTVRIFDEGKENYIYWRVNDMANTGQVRGGPYRVLIDRSPLNFSNPRPDPNSMLAELEIPCQITIRDVGGSGVDPESVEFRYQTGEMEDFTEWNSTCITYNKKTNGYDFLVYIIFQPGDSNYIQWRGKDHAGSGPFESMTYSIYINSPPMIKIKNPTPTGIYYEQEDIIFDARNSFDPDFGDTLSFFWRSNKTGILGHKDSFKARLLPGTHRITLWVCDDHYHNVSAEIEITVMWLDLDGDGIPDIKDPDIDGDDHLNDEDAFPFDRTEWMDTDFDTIGNNKDPDDDNDGYPDDEDEFPLDKDQWRKEASESSNSLLIIMLVVFVIIIILGVFAFTKYRAEHKKKAVEGEIGVGAEGEDRGDSATPTMTPTQPPSPMAMGSGQYGPSPPYPQSMFIPSQPLPMAPMPYLPPPGFTGMGGGMGMNMNFPTSTSQPMQTQTQPMQTPTYIQSLPQLPPAQVGNTEKKKLSM